MFTIDDVGQVPQPDGTFKELLPTEKQAIVDEWNKNQADPAPHNAQVMAKLQEIDIKSIRAIREYIAAKADAPQFVKDHETAARAERAKIKK